MMRKLFLAALTPLLFLTLSAHCETIPGADSRVTYIGRTAANAGAVSFDWTGVYLKVRFQGTSLSMRVSETRKNYYNIWIDSQMDAAPDKVLAVHGQDTSIVILSQEEFKARFGKDRKAARLPHQIILQKRTEGEQGTTTITSFTTDGTFLQADAPRERIIEYIGDSYTCGYGTEASSSERFSPSTENQNLTYACEVARFFGADQIVVAHSGMGIIRNYNGNIPDEDMPQLYLRTFDRQKEPLWDAGSSPLKPSITVIYLGANDFSTGMQPSQSRFTTNYIALLRQIKENYGPDHPILCIVPKHDFMMVTYIKNAVDTCSLSDVHLLPLPFCVHNSSSDLGADGHPNYSGHTKIAYAVIPCVASITGWAMDSNTVK